MGTQDIAAALQRVKSVFQRRPEFALSDDHPATARWESGMRVVSSHEDGTEIATDMPAELGGTGDKVTPGWLFRAGLASCATTSIAMAAATDGIELSTLEVRASSRSDARGMFGMADADGKPVSAAPGEVQLDVRIAAHAVSAERLRTLVETGCQRSPIPIVVTCATPLALHIDVAVV